MNRNDLFDYIINNIKENFERGNIPWRKPWKASVPMNFITRRPYNGVNYILLSMTDYPSPFFLTYLQCQTLNGKILKGSKGYPIVYWKLHDVSYYDEEKDEMQVKKVSIFKVSYVFNIAQTTLYIESHDWQKKLLDCEYIIERLEPKPVIKNNFQRCYYDALEDYISIPPIDYFNSVEEYYSSLFHELIHWTSHPLRLNRITSPTEKKSKDETAMEEIIAEIGSSFLCGLCGISPKILENQSAYINGWLKFIKNDPMAFIKAIQLARQAVDYIVPESVYALINYI